MGSIPAQAGEPRWNRTRIRSASRVYPRAGGGTGNGARTVLGGRVYPRAGGGTGDPPLRYSPTGSIPAQAGEPRGNRLGVYPRAGGGTGVVRRIGVYPRAGGGTDMTGSIPAQAGEPSSDDVRWLTKRVYPRAGGGTDRRQRATRTMTVRAHRQGLSPRRRGNLVGPSGLPAAMGSIPAQAGEPLVTKSLNYLQCQRT